MSRGTRDECLRWRRTHDSNRGSPPSPGQVANRVKYRLRKARINNRMGRKLPLERSLPHGHVELLLELVRQLNLPSLIASRPSPDVVGSPPLTENPNACGGRCKCLKGIRYDDAPNGLFSGISRQLDGRRSSRQESWLLR